MKNIKLFSIFLFLFSALAVQQAFAVPYEAYRSYVRGLLDLKNGDMVSALSEYENVVELDKNAASVYGDLAFLYWRNGDKDKALEAAGKYEELSEDKLSTELFLGNFYLMTGDSAKARGSWEKALKLDPENEMAILYLAAYHSSENDPEKAMAYWEKYIAKVPDSDEAFYQLGLNQEKLKRDEDAKRSYQQAIKLKPDSPEPYISLAQIYEKDNDLGQAILNYEKYLEAVGNSPTVELYLGGLYIKAQEYAKAQKVFEAIRDKNPYDKNVYFWLGVLAEKKKDWGQAIKCFKKINGWQENAPVLMRLSYYYSMLGRRGTAIKYLKAVVKKAPQDADASYLLGLAYMDVKKYREGEEALLRTIELKPAMEEAQFSLAVLYDEWGKFDKAKERFNKLLEQNPDHAAALNYLGYSYADRHIDLDEAQKLIEKAVKLEPNNASYLDSLGWVFYGQGKFSEAREQIEKAIGIIKDPVIYEHLGEVDLKLEKYADAWEAFSDSLALNPKNKKVKAKMDELEKKVLPNTLQRKILKRACGNLLQVSALKASFVADGTLRDKNFRLYGVLYYSRPDRWRIDILGNFMAPRTIVMKNGDTPANIYPETMRNVISDDYFEAVNLIGDYLNAGLCGRFDSEKASIIAKGGNIFYTLGNDSLLLNKNNGTAKNIELDRNIKLNFNRYQLLEGLYLPSDLTVSIPADKLDVRFVLKGFALNRDVDTKVFSFDGAAPQ
jgi:tetratricopeptide (TPR) repeat protein